MIVPDAPINLANQPKITNAYQVGLTWEKGENEGGTPITEYVLSYDQGTDGAYFFVFADGITTTDYIATGLIPGVNYHFKVQARNSFGLSDYSTEKIVLTAQKPDDPQAPFTSMEGNYVKI